MPILVHFKAKNNDNSYFYKNSGLSFPWVPYYLKRDAVFKGLNFTSHLSAYSTIFSRSALRSSAATIGSSTMIYIDLYHLQKDV